MPDLCEPTSITAASPGHFGHIPVLRDEVLAALLPGGATLMGGKCFVDGTVGAGGHAEALLQALPTDSRLVGIDQDPVALGIAAKRLETFGERIQLLERNFSELPNFAGDADFLPITGGLLVDLGVSSMQLDTAERGFSFAKDAPLDMRMSTATALTAETVVNTYPEEQLKRLFSEYGEEHLAGSIARAIGKRREKTPFHRTKDLAQLIYDQYAGHGKTQGKKAGTIHPATRVFQALRIEVNDELGHLSRLLDSIPRLLAPGARVAVISFHSLEDRLVKQAFKQAALDCVCPPRFPICQCDHRATLKLVSGKPIVATEQETQRNPRSRSAKLRVVERV